MELTYSTLEDVIAYSNRANDAIHDKVIEILREK